MLKRKKRKKDSSNCNNKNKQNQKINDVIDCLQIYKLNMYFIIIIGIQSYIYTQSMTN